LNEPLPSPSKLRHLPGVSWLRCQCGYVDNAWAVAGHRGRHVAPTCNGVPIAASADDLLAIKAPLPSDIDGLERWTLVLLAFYYGLRKSDLAALTHDDFEEPDDDGESDGDEFLFRIRRTRKAIKVTCIEHGEDNTHCPRCAFEWFLVMKIKEQWGWQGPVFPNARKPSRPAT
jgi:hypothetical protein